MNRTFLSRYINFDYPNNPLAIYSTRLVNGDYYGNCVHVRLLSNPSVNADIGFDNVGRLDISALKTLSNSDTYYVQTWYDQSGNNINLIQTNTSLQPALLIVGNNSWIALANQYLVNVNGVGSADVDQTIGMTIWEGGDKTTLFPLASYNSGAGTGWAFITNFNSPKDPIIWASNGTFVTGNTSLMSHSPNRLISTRASGNTVLYLNNNVVATATNQSNPNTSRPLTVGAYWDGVSSYVQSSYFITSEIFLYNTALANTTIQSIDTNMKKYWQGVNFSQPHSGNSSVQFDIGEYIILNSSNAALQFEYTQPWTTWVSSQLWGPGTIQVFLSNVPQSNDGAYPGWEFWIDGNNTSLKAVPNTNINLLRARLNHNVGGNVYIDVIGSTNVVDGHKHMFVASYDGSGFANGIQFYIDGVAETMTIVSDTLQSNTIIAANNGQQMNIGCRTLGNNSLRGIMNHCQVDIVKQTNAYITEYSTSGNNLPPVNANTILCLTFNEDTGNVTFDVSNSGFDGALSSNTMWIP